MARYLPDLTERTESLSKSSLKVIACITKLLNSANPNTIWLHEKDFRRFHKELNNSGFDVERGFSFNGIKCRSECERIKPTQTSKSEGRANLAPFLRRVK